MDKKQREERRRQEDIALQRGLLWVAGAIVLEALLVLVNRFYINIYLDKAEVDRAILLDRLLHILRLAAPAAALLALAWTAWQLKQGKKFVPALVLSIALGACGICSHIIVQYQGAGVSMLFWLVAAWAVLALVYYIYQREFFLAASACGMSVLGLWLVRHGGQLEALLALIAIALVAAAALWMKKNNGVLLWNLAFLPSDTNYTVLLASCAASLAAVLAALLLRGIAGYYLIYVMIAWLFALFVYYTVKLM